MAIFDSIDRIVFAGDGNLSSRDGFVQFLVAYADNHSLPFPGQVSSVPMAGWSVGDYPRKFVRDVYPAEPEAIVVILGNTDILFSTGSDIDLPVRCFERFIEEILKVVPPSKLLICSTLLLADDPGYSKNLQAAEYNKAVEVRCANSGIEYLDLFSGLSSAAERLAPARLSVDGTLLSSLGHFVLFELFAEYAGFYKRPH